LNIVSGSNYNITSSNSNHSLTSSRLDDFNTFNSSSISTDQYGLRLKSNNFIDMIASTGGAISLQPLYSNIGNDVTGNNITVDSSLNKITFDVVNVPILNITSSGIVVTGSIISDTGLFNTDGAGNLKINNLIANGYLQTDVGTIYSDGSGNLTVNSINVEGIPNIIDDNGNVNCNVVTAGNINSLQNYFTSHSLTPYSGSAYNVNFNYAYQFISGSGANLNFVSSSNKIASNAYNSVIYIAPTTGSRNISFNSNWIFIGAQAPTVITGSKAAVLSLSAFGASENSVVATFGLQS
jgi:hypothetical protein